MKKIYFTICILALSFPCLALDFFQGSYSDALKKAKDENKQIFLYFTAKWCGPCKYMDSYIFIDEALSSYAKENYISIKIDIDTQAGKKVYYKYAAVGLPDFYIITPNEEILKRKLGAMKLGQVKDFLRKVETSPIALKVASDSLASIKVAIINRRVDSLLERRPELSNSPKFIDRAKPDSIAGIKYAEAINKKPGNFEKFMFNAGVSKWKPGVKMGFNTSNLDQPEYDSRNISGFYGGIFFDFTSLKESFLFQPGIQFNSKGGSISGITTHINYIEMPLLFSYQIARKFILGHQDLRFNFTPYSAFNLWTSQKMIASGSAPVNIASDVKKFDYGAKLGFSFGLGSFEPSVGYDIGLSNISNNPAYKIYNRSYYLSFALIFGK
jgi:thiol-disulfide isomerase/thioredoxin